MAAELTRSETNIPNAWSESNNLFLCTDIGKITDYSDIRYLYLFLRRDSSMKYNFPIFKGKMGIAMTVANYAAKPETT